MFSEYASRFLARSHIREGGRQSLYHPTNAPLFFSAADYPSEDREHDQEVSAIYALQKSRRNLYYSVDQDDEDDDKNYSDAGSVNDGIRSSWNPGHSAASDLTETAGGNNMVDVSLGEESLTQRRSDGINLNHDGRFDSLLETSRDTDDPSHPPIQKFRSQNSRSLAPLLNVADSSQETTYPDGRSSERQNTFYGSDAAASKSRIAENRRGPPPDPTPHPVDHQPPIPPACDRLWTKIYGVSMACMFATAFIVWLHTDEPKGSPIGDSIYIVLQRSLPFLALDTLVTICVACVWMLCLKFFIRPLLYLLCVLVPMVMIALTIYPLVTSLNGPWKGKSLQDRVMRVTSLFPLLLAFLWVYMLYRRRLALHKATSILQLALTIFTENPALLFCGLLTLIATVSFSWLWIFLVVRVFLNGRSSMIGGVPVWQPDGTAWALGACFVYLYLWTLGTLSNLQRVTTSATVSHWYFYRKSAGVSSPVSTVKAAMYHTSTTMLGTACFSSFITLMIRLPLLVLPSRIGSLVHLLSFNLVASPILALSDPLTVTYAAIHSLPLVQASRQTDRLGLITSVLGEKGSHTRKAYRLSKMLLTAARWMTSLALGIGAWVRTAHINDRGSLYGYVVGLLAGSIGWTILGAAERSLANVVDACLVCAASDNSEGRYCREAQTAFEGF